MAKKKAKNQGLIYLILGVVSAGVVALIAWLPFISDVAIKEYVYLAASIILTFGVLVDIAFMSKVNLSKIGNRVSAVCMLLAIALTLVYNNILGIWTLYIGIALGTIIRVSFV